MSTAIQTMDQVTAKWLTGVLCGAGCLEQGDVLEVVTHPRPSGTSTVCGLELRYSGDAPSSAPRRLFLKFTNPSTAGALDGLARKEVAFFANVARRMPDPPYPHCYDSAYCPDTNSCHVLLEDLSDTHTSLGIAPDRDRCLAAMDSLGRFHAFWWDHPGLATTDAMPTQESQQQYQQEIERHLPGFLAALGEDLSNQDRQVLERAACSMAYLRRRLTSSRNLCIAHGDGHLMNFLFPLDPASGDVRIIDWQFWHINAGPYDLHMVVLNWPPALRRDLEGPLVRRYHESLCRHGVTGYRWDECWRDYRWAIIDNLFMPLWWWCLGQPRKQWLDVLGSALQAFRDLQCDELL